MLNSIVRREHCFAALCDSCGLPIERSDEGRWTVPRALVFRRDHVRTTRDMPSPTDKASRSEVWDGTGRHGTASLV